MLKGYIRKQNAIYMKKDEQIMNGAEAPETGSKAKEKDNVDQFPDQDTKIKHKTSFGKHSGYQEGRLLNFNDFIAKKINKNTIEKDAMDGVKAGDDNHDTLDDKDKTQHKTMK